MRAHGLLLKGHSEVHTKELAPANLENKTGLDKNRWFWTPFHLFLVYVCIYMYPWDVFAKLVTLPSRGFLLWTA
jgi:hypothetical protein